MSVDSASATSDVNLALRGSANLEALGFKLVPACVERCYLSTSHR